MANIPGNTEWIADLIPGIGGLIGQFSVATDEVDDELIEVFIEELKRLTNELQDGMQRNDDELVRMAAHSIKGMGGTIGLPEISVLALTVENAAKEDRLQDARPLTDALGNWVDSLT